MAPVGRLYRRTMWRGIGAPTWLGEGVGCAAMAYGWRLWRMVSAYGVWLAPMAYGWRLWRMVSACGVQGADRVDGLQREAVVPMCRAYVSSWLRLYADMVAWLWRERVRLWLRSIGYGSYGVLCGV